MLPALLSQRCECPTRSVRAQTPTHSSAAAAAELKEIFDEVGVSYKGLSKDALKAKAYKEGVMRK